MAVHPAPWYTVNNLNEIDSPAFLVYYERVQQNITAALEMAGEAAKLRPHVKTHKSPDVTKLMLHAGITKFKASTIAEAEMLAQCKAPDVLLAYQPAGPKIGRFLTLVKSFPATRFSCLIDSVDAATALAKEAAAESVTLNVFIDVNLGMNRTGVLPQKAFELCKTTSGMYGLNIIGLHGYDGHINDTDLALRKQRADEAFRQLANVQETLIEAGFLQPVIVVGGSPTFPFHAQQSNVECSPGTFVYWDKSYSDLFPDINFLPAAIVLSRVVSIVDQNTICVDLGHKSVASENSLSRRVHWLNAPALVPVSHSEEHLVLHSVEAHNYKVGDVLYGIPFHVCPTSALYETAFVVKDQFVKEGWRTEARNRTISV